MLLSFNDFIFEDFKKSYGKTEEDRKHFKSLKKGDKILYVGKKYKVVDKTDYTITIENEDGRSKTINFSQFSEDGAIPKD